MNGPLSAQALRACATRQAPLPLRLRSPLLPRIPRPKSTTAMARTATQASNRKSISRRTRPHTLARSLTYVNHTALKVLYLHVIEMSLLPSYHEPSWKHERLSSRLPPCPRPNSLTPNRHTSTTILATRISLASSAQGNSSLRETAQPMKETFMVISPRSLASSTSATSRSAPSET